MKRRIAFLLALTVMSVSAARAANSPLALEAKIPLGAVSGRIDHMAFDPVRRRLIIAELGNNTVAVVDVAKRTVIRRLAGLSEPQGVAYVAAANRLYVANAGDGSVRLFSGDDFQPAGRIALGEDADNIRYDARAGLLYVGYGGGALAVIDAARGERLRDIPLPGHPEAFQLDPRSGRIFVNVPDVRQIVVVDRRTGARVAAWKASGLGANFPMAFDTARNGVVVAYRRPARLVAFEPATGAITAMIDTCGDADDVFVDGRRGRIYVSCGAGSIDVFETTGRWYRRLARIETVRGARTALFVPALDRLFLAVRARGGEAAAIWVFRPEP